MIKRKYNIRAAEPSNFVTSRIADAARRLGRNGDLAHRVELANEALSKAVVTLYEQKDAHDNGRILIPLPWGAKGWKGYGLRQHEARTLSRVLLARQAVWSPSTRPPLFVYDEASRRWCLNIDDWAELSHAMFWLMKSQITLREWKEQSDG